MSPASTHIKIVIFLSMAKIGLGQETQSGIQTALARNIQTAEGSVVSVRCNIRNNNQPCSHTGSGFIWKSDGLVVTRSRVVSGSDNIAVTLRDGRTFAARVVGEDEDLRLSLLKIPTENLPVLTPGATDSLKKGSTMVVIGNSLGVFPSVAVGGFLETRDDGLILLDLHVPPGSCGSPVLDEAGRLIGIWIGHSRKESNDAADAGLGLALPIEKMIPALEAILVPPNGWVGISVVDLERNVFGKGVRVIGVTPDGPAAKAAIAVGDTLVGFRGKPVETAASLARRVRLCKPGTPEVFMVRHAGQEFARRIEIQAGP